MTFFNHPGKSIRIYRKLFFRRVKISLRNFLRALGYSEIYVARSFRKLKKREIKKQTESLTRDAIYEHGRRIAEEHVTHQGKGSRHLLFRRFRFNCKVLDLAHTVLEESARKQELLTPGAEWLLDNYHLVLQQIAAIKKHFPRGYDRSLPKLAQGRFADYPRVYDLALELLQKTDAVANVDLFTSFIRGYQSHTALSMGEIWAIPIMIRFALIENLSSIVTRMADAREERSSAAVLINEIIGDESKTGTQILEALSGYINLKPELLFRGSSHIISRLREMGKKSYLALQWLEERIREEGFDPEELHRNEQYLLAADQVSIGNTFNSLRSINLIDWKEWFEEVSVVEQILSKDPSGYYKKGDFQTRDSCRHVIELIAKKSSLSEVEIANNVIAYAEQKKVELSQTNEEDRLFFIKRTHVGYYLVGEGLKEFEVFLNYKPPLYTSLKRWMRKRAFPLYALGVLILTFSFLFYLGIHLNSVSPGIFASIIISLFFVIPASDLAISFVQWIVTHLVRPDFLSKLDFSEGIPEECRTAVVVQTILNDKTAVKNSLEALEIRYLSNNMKNAVFGLLADFSDADSESLHGDKEVMQYAQEMVSSLCKRHNSNVFFVLFRRRQWNEAQRKFMGWERKRGKIEEFNSLIVENSENSFYLNEDLRKLLDGVVYVVTLDNDSQLPHGSLHKLVGTIAHPLNAPLISQRGDDLSLPVITEGYSIIQPRVGVSLISATASRFARLFSGHAGLDPYTQTVSEVYQDLFSEGSFVGKGIYHARAFHSALQRRVPENSILSHDLFEGCFARVALATDIELFEDFSTKYHVHARRQHRWVRGDWQLLPWIFFRVPDNKYKYYTTCLSSLARWKILDNLRRSLLAPSLYFYFLSLVVFLNNIDAVLFLLGVLVIAFPVYANVAQAFLIPPRGLSLEGHMKGLGRNVFLNSKQALFTLCFIPHQAFLMMHAISLTLYRVIISRKKMLEWETAYHSEKRLGQNLTAYLSEMKGGVALTLCMLLCVIFSPTQPAAVGMALFALWIISPFTAKYLSSAYLTRKHSFSQSEKLYLEKVAEETWRFFREHMTEENNYLVPDNMQLVPNRVVVDRSSITNISLSLLTVVSAYDFGFLSLSKKIELLNKVYATLLKLDRFHGNFFNWYNIKDLSALHPRYVSMVDSGNMLGYLICMRTVFENIKNQPLYTKSNLQKIQQIVTKLNSEVSQKLQSERFKALTAIDYSGLSGIAEIAETLSLLKEFSTDLEDNKSALKVQIDDIAEGIVYFSWLPDLKKILSIFKEASIKEEIIIELEKAINSVDITPASLDKLFAQLSDFITYIKSESFPMSLISTLLQHRESFERKLLGSIEAFAALLNDASVSSKANDLLLEEMDFRFLYDSKRNLFPIGYDVDNARRDPSYYDLLASESRLGSFAAIALGQIPQKHWFLLGRPLTDTIGGKTLISWSGTMFEYLMPLLVTKDYPGTLLSESYKAAVRTQILYAAKRGVPWGISESGYSGVDFEKTYQYHAFGVPGLGLKRDLESDLVISPYSTFLALPFAEKEGLQNLQFLEQQGARGEYGFYEAVDYTPSRLHDNEKKHIVQSYLAHHQAMIIIALDNLLNENIMQQRFHQDLQVRSVELLLHEKFPDRIPLISPHNEHDFTVKRAHEEEEFVTTQVIDSPHTTLPVTHILSNSQYSLMVDNAGSGYSSFAGDVALTRWKEDAVANNKGFYVFIREPDKKRIWSNTYQPTCVQPDQYDVIFGPDKVEFKRKDFDIFVHSEITISPEDNVEIRKLTFSNLSAVRRILDVTSYGEVVLGSQRADDAHPAFAKMFIESEHIGDLDCLVFSRRPRSKHEKRLYFMHMLTMPTVWDKVHFETSRADFHGRCNDLRDSQALAFENNLAGRAGYILDPIFSLRTKVELEPGQNEVVIFINSISHDKEHLFSIAHRYKQMHQISRAFEMAWSQSSVELRNEKIAARQSQLFQRLANLLLFNNDKFRASSELISNNRLTQPALWRLGISGDIPIVLLRITQPDQVKIVNELLAAHHYLRVRGMIFDLVILNEYPGGYLQNLQEELEYQMRSSFSGYLIDKNGGVFLRNLSQVSQQEVDLLKTVAKVMLSGSRGALSAQLKPDEFTNLKHSISEFNHQGKSRGLIKKEIKDCEFYNGVGGFVSNGDSYRIFIENNNFPPMPWSNVIANPDFGTLVTESGGGYTWSENSRENRMTAWNNDPIIDPPSEVLYIREIDSSKFWSLTPRPVISDALFIVEHSRAYSSFHTEIESVESKLTIEISGEKKIKFWNIELKNHSSKSKNLELFLYLEWVLGVSRHDSNRYTCCNYDAKSKLLYAYNYYNSDFSGRIVGIGSDHKIKGFTTERVDFLGRNGSSARPYVFMSQDAISGVPISLNKKLSVGNDSCGVLRVNIKLQPGEKQNIRFYLLEAATLEELGNLAADMEDDSRDSVKEKSLRQYYDNVHKSIQVKTPDKSFDILINSWLLYQTLACRIYARTGFYQSGGAYGFRDQLQDVLALVYSKPDLARRQIILHASRQFPEGDVQHWWHPPSGKGVRTKISDDYLWLPYVTAKYLEQTGDFSILNEQTGFVSGPLLAEYEHEIYIVPQKSDQISDIYTHCKLAIERGMKFGSHGLPLMGAGDWNDGMNEVGFEGKGESVWLAWFYIEVLNLFSFVAENRNESEISNKYRNLAKQLSLAVDKHAWDGKWYRRAYFDDGTPLGSHINDECQIDSISQSWGIISGAADPAKAKIAMENVMKILVRDQDKIICLLHPAFNNGSLEPGYIKGYLPGIRENGGQYTHAAAWTVIATAMTGKGTEAANLFSMINPINHTKDINGVNKYKGEPYVLCGDVYAVEPHVGRAGWSWYTGSAGWMYKAGIEYILGLKIYSDYFTLKPCIPASWSEYGIELNMRDARYSIKIENPDNLESGLAQIWVDGENIIDGKVKWEKYSGRLQVDVKAVLKPS